MNKFIGIGFAAIVFSILLIPLTDAATPDIWKVCNQVNQPTIIIGDKTYTCCDTDPDAGSPYTWEWKNQATGDDTSACDPPDSAFDTPPTPIDSSWQSANFNIQAKYTADNGLSKCRYNVWSNNVIGFERTYPTLTTWDEIDCSGYSQTRSFTITVGGTNNCKYEGTKKCLVQLEAYDGINTGMISRKFSIDWTNPVAGNYTINGKSTGPVYTNGPLNHKWGSPTQQFSDPGAGVVPPTGSGLYSFEIWRASPYDTCKPDSLGGCFWLSWYLDSATPATGSWTETITADYWYGWHSSDNAGNWIKENTPIEVRYDVIKPTVDPKISEGQTYINAPPLNIDFHDNYELGDIYCQFDSNAGSWGAIATNVGNKDYTTDWSASNCGNWDSLSEGTHYIYFKVSDDAGNLYITPNNDAGFTIIKDTQAPTFIEITSVGGDTSRPYLTKDNTPDVVFTTNENAWCKISITDQSYDSMVTNCAVGEGSTSHTCTSPSLTDGDKNIYISCRDDAQNKNTNLNNKDISVTIDTQVDTRIDSGPSGTVAYDDARFTFSCVGGETCTFECSLDYVEFASCSSGITYTSLSEGRHTFQVKGTDEAGNPDLEPAQRPWTVDTVPPTRYDGRPTGYVATSSPLLSLRTDEAATCKYKQLTEGASGVPYDDMTTMQTTGATSHSQPLSGLTPKTYRYDVKCKDFVNNKNTNDWVITFDVCLRANPTVSITNSPPLSPTPPIQQGEPGQEKEYTVQIINNDQNCGTESFDLTTIGCPAGWTCSLASSLSINSGSSASTTLSITSSTSAKTGHNLVNVEAKNSADKSFKNTAPILADYEIICIYRLSLNKPREAEFDMATKHGQAEAVYYTWTMDFSNKDPSGKASSSSCELVGGKWEYEIRPEDFTLTGTCHSQTGIYTGKSTPPGGAKATLPFKFSVSSGGSNSALKVFVKRETSDFCTLSFNLRPTQPGTLEFDPSFTVGAIGVTQPPQVSFFDFSGDKTVFNVKWEAFYPDEPFRTMEVKCGLNCDPGNQLPGTLPDCQNLAGQECSPYPVQMGTEEIKKGSCSISSPAYNFATDKIMCLFYDPNNQALNTLVNHDFTTIDFDVRPDNGYKITTTIGHKFDLKIDVTNKGTLADSYLIELTGPQTVEISPTTITTPTIASNQLVSATSSITPLVDQTSTITLKVTSLTSGKVITRSIEVNPGLFALPEFGLQGFLQIIVLATIVYFLLFNQIKRKSKRR